MPWLVVVSATLSFLSHGLNANGDLIAGGSLRSPQPRLLLQLFTLLNVSKLTSYRHVEVVIIFISLPCAMG
jgi:hypothetical protein